MAARPRTHKISIPNLYCKLDKRTGKVYWQYKHPTTGRFHSLGTDEAEAKQVANEANTIIAEQRTRQILSVNDRLARMKGKRTDITVTEWIDKYIVIQEERLKNNELRQNSFRQKNKPLRLFREHRGMRYLKDIETIDIAEITDAIKNDGFSRMAQVVRIVLVDVFKEAQHAGYVPPGYNPAMATKQPRHKVTRQRLSLEEWKSIYEAAETMQPYLQCGMLLALVTGQRLGDICRMKFSDIWDDMLHIEQEKTGSRLAIPLDLKCDALGLTLRDVVSKCRDAVISKYLVHFRHSTSQATRGDSVSSSSLTTSFKKARNKCGIEWEKGTAPTFHEQRSLSERLYEAQGVDTQKLLGHKSPQQTAKYHDDRGKDWTVIAV
ncbi:phage integrase Arm DNA-binding domain-containing protein [Enterobacter roggenkampii]|uniref:phage integrase Arm DNA-binding domain-containing protein n=1 Tax=Enterobacter roggenkampii TaxID=1812935 RepID=UPI001C5A6FA9|nr:phage integrase Arm DNA-binding domain-containing protein [Enterobacter roggenkampii]MBW4220411.1 phage integrase Arm DNA-binding domain-containing protein [Enterobacter roggenkampii]MCK6940549.1 phage integrase Arm DNA-binding domain-containing protein [Enterobacter roggenkampii]MCK7075339.1 phage integrase Arm DNA-binding domain-containing protein [Enterobacter roggenkampii]WFX60095.1 phage integrase Arm DNA-binding domain-containing protein [Enterobacter roggenkampii]HCM9501039.1 phage i